MDLTERSGISDSAKCKDLNVLCSLPQPPVLQGSVLHSQRQNLGNSHEAQSKDLTVNRNISLHGYIFLQHTFFFHTTVVFTKLFTVLFINVITLCAIHIVRTIIRILNELLISMLCRLCFVLSIVPKSEIFVKSQSSLNMLHTILNSNPMRCS